MKVCLLLLLWDFSGIFSVFVVNKFNGQFNKAFINLSINVQSDGIHDPTVDVWWDQFVVLEDFLIQGRIKVPETSNDDVYQKEFIRFTLDGSKVFGDGHTNFLVKIFMDSFVDKLDFEPKLPLKKGPHRITNVTVSDSLVPSFVPSKLMVDVRVLGKLPKRKPKITLGQYASYCEIKR